MRIHSPDIIARIYFMDVFQPILNQITICSTDFTVKSVIYKLNTENWEYGGKNSTVLYKILQVKEKIDSSLFSAACCNDIQMGGVSNS